MPSGLSVDIVISQGDIARVDLDSQKVSRLDKEEGPNEIPVGLDNRTTPLDAELG